MTPHAAKLVTEKELLLFQRIQHAIQNLPDHLEDSGGVRIEVCCHKLARAVAYVFQVVKVDGFFIDIRFPHSWVETDSGNIIDVYPIAMVGGPVMIDTNHSHGLFSRTYVPLDRPRRRPNFHETTFRRHVAVISKALRQQQPDLPLE